MYIAPFIPLIYHHVCNWILRSIVFHPLLCVHASHRILCESQDRVQPGWGQLLAFAPHPCGDANAVKRLLSIQVQVVTGPGVKELP